MSSAAVQQAILQIFKEALNIEVPSPEHDLLEARDE